MPSRNALKLYSEDGCYHIYNRGVAKNIVFEDKQDYLVFMSYLKDYLSALRPLTEEEIMIGGRPPSRKNYYQQIELLSFVLMPNHFHLLLKQKQSRTVEYFMRSLLTRYVKYFNRRYERVGHLFQDVYKAVLIERDEYLWWLTRYIHRNPKEILSESQGLLDYPYSSYPAYIGRRNSTWVSVEDILAQIKNYRSFVEDDKQSDQAPQVLSELILEAGEI